MYVSAECSARMHVFLVLDVRFHVLHFAFVRVRARAHYPTFVLQVSKEARPQPLVACVCVGVRMCKCVPVCVVACFFVCLSLCRPPRVVPLRD